MAVSEKPGNKSLIILVGLLVLLLLAPLVLSRFYVYFLALLLVTGLLATSLNLVLGFGGLYQFHHAVFYGFGAYACALFLTKTSLGPLVAFAAGPLAAAGLSLVMGLICLKVSKLYFGMLQISLGSLVWAIVFRWYSFTGGDNGLQGLPVPGALASVSKAYYFTLTVTVVSLAVLYVIINSAFGRVFQAVRDNPERSATIGVDVAWHQLLGMVLAGFFAGVAGVLYVVVEGAVHPDMMFWTLSLEILIMCLLGGWFTFLGPMLGAGIMVTLRTVVGIYTEYWTLVEGIILMFLIFFLPQGVLGFLIERLSSTSTRMASENK